MSRGSKIVDDSVKYELIGVGLLTIAAFGLVSLYWDGGTLGNFIAKVLKIVSGKGAVFVPIAIGYYGCRMILQRKKPEWDSSAYGLIVALVLTLTTFHLLSELAPVNYLEAGKKGLGGGVVGGVFALLIHKAFGTIGSYIILAAGFLSVLILVAKISLVGSMNSVGKGAKSTVQKVQDGLYDFFFTTEEELDSDETTEQPKASRLLPVFSGPVIVDHSRDVGTAHGKGIIDLAKSVVDRAFPSVEIFSDAWDGKVARDGHEPPSFVEELLDDELLDEHSTPEQVCSDTKKETVQHREVDARETISVPESKLGYKMPTVELLNKPTRIKSNRLNKDITDNVRILEETLENFGVKAKVTQVSRGPAITRYELQPAPGVKVSRIVNLADDLSLSLAASGVRIEAPIPGKAAIGIEVPNKDISMVHLRDLLESPEFVRANSLLSVSLGKDIAGTPIIADLAKMPHLLIAGSTGSGKSVCMNTLISSILFKARPDQVKFLMIDPKMVELTTYNGIPHLIAPVVTDPKKAATALRWVVSEMENRYSLFAESGVKNITGYNSLRQKSSLDELPLVVVLIDELADLMMVAPADIEDAICRLAQMARAAGIHLVVATQRPSVDVITGLIKANIPSRIAFAVSSQIDSRTILDMGGAEKLLGKGDMLFFPVGAAKPLRVQGVFASEKEIESVVSFIKTQGTPEYQEGLLKVEASKREEPQIDEDELLPQAVSIVLECGQASISMLQRRLRIGYTRAARLMDIMEERGFVGGYEGSKPRNVLITLDKFESIFGPKG